MFLKNPKKEVGDMYQLVNLRYYRYLQKEKWLSYNKKPGPGSVNGAENGEIS